jgi:hypothetical protein
MGHPSLATLYKVLELKQHKERFVDGKSIASMKHSRVRLETGTRVIAVFKEIGSAGGGAEDEAARPLLPGDCGGAAGRPEQVPLPDILRHRLLAVRELQQRARRLRGEQERLGGHAHEFAFVHQEVPGESGQADGEAVQRADGQGGV